MRISELNRKPELHHDQEITIAGAVRVTYQNPFPQFLLEDASGVLLCRPNGDLPLPGAHIEISGLFQFATPEGCTVALPLLTEIHRSYLTHQTGDCFLSACEFAAHVAA